MTGQMDMNVLAAEIVDSLGPALPYLLQVAGHTADAAAKDLGEGAWERAKQLWQRLRGDGSRAAEIERAAQEATVLADDDQARELAQAALRLQVMAALRANTTLAQAVAELVSRPSYRIEQRDGGAVAVGEGAQATVMNLQIADGKPARLREAYLHRLLSQVRQVSLAEHRSGRGGQRRGGPARPRRGLRRPADPAERRPRRARRSGAPAAWWPAPVGGGAGAAAATVAARAPAAGAGGATRPGGTGPAAAG